MSKVDRAARREACRLFPEIEFPRPSPDNHHTVAPHPPVMRPRCLASSRKRNSLAREQETSFTCVETIPRKDPHVPALVSPTVPLPTLCKLLARYTTAAYAISLLKQLLG